MKSIIENLKQLGQTAEDNFGMIMIAVLVVAVIIAVAYLMEYMISLFHGEKKRTKETLKVHRMTLIALLTALSEILMLFEVPVFFVPSFYELDFSELPILIGAFAMGPVAGVLMEFLKVLLNLFINGTDTAFVGEFANFCMGCCFIVPASTIYYAKKAKAQAIIGLVTGTITATIACCFLNAYLLLPTYAKLFHMDLSAIVAMGTKVNGGIDSLLTFVVLAVAPFNLIKYGLVSVITLLVYKHISRLIKRSL